MKKIFLKLSLLSCLLIALFSCSEEQPKTSTALEYSDYIQMYTSGVLSKNDVVRIVLTQPIDPNKLDWEGIKKELLLFSPSIDGELILQDNNTLIFEPASQLMSGQKYAANLALKQLFDVEDDLEQFRFDFEVIPQNFDVFFSGIETHTDDPSKVNIKGTIDFADFVSLEDVKKVVKATLGANELVFSWESGGDTYRQHRFKIEGQPRKDVVQNIVLSWDGAPLDIDNKGSRTIEVPALGDFSLLTSRIKTSPSYFLSLNFSDPVDANQNLDGLIEIEGEDAALRFEVEGNEVKVYVPENFDANKTVLVHQGLKNVFGKQIGKTIEAHVIFEQVKPEVRFVGDGSILPSSQGLVLPFEAISLKAVDVRVKRIYSNNMLQFFQVNEYDGSYQMNRVGEVVFQKVMPLNGDAAINLNSWNRFTLNLDELIKKEEGAIYHVEIGFRRHQSLYICDEEYDASQVDENSDEYWNKFNRYVFDYDYRWRDREKPCKSAYFGHDRTVQKNILASDIGLIAKKAESGKMQFFVTNLKTTDPISGAVVSLYSYQQQVIQKSSTDSDGKCTFQLKELPYIAVASYGNQKTYLKINGEASLSVSNFEVGGKHVNKGIKGLIYGERGVWRPGDSLFISLMVEDKQELLPLNQPVVFELNNPRGQLVERRVVTENVNGLYKFITKTGDEAPTGTWSVKVKVGGTSFHKTLKIETIKPNRLKINLDFGKETLTYEDKSLTGQLNVKWLHGAVGNNMKAEFNMKLKRSNINFKEFKGYTFNNPHVNFSSEEFEVFNGKTDPEGNATIEADIKLATNVPPKLNAVFTGKVYEPSGNYSISYQSIPYYPYESMVGVKVQGADRRYSFLETDVKHLVDIACVDAKGNGVTRENVTVKLYKLKWRWWWDYNSGRSNYNSSYNREFVTSGKVDVVKGRGQWGFQVDYPSWGRYLVEVVDPVSGHTSGRIFYIDWPYWRGSSKKGMKEGASMLQLSAEKETYNIGETVNIKVPTTEGGNVLVSLETGSQILKTFWVKASNKVTEISFKVDKEMTPNVYANIMVLQPHMQSVNDLPIRMYGVIPIMVEDKDTKLKPSIEMPKVLEPLKEVNIAVKETTGKSMTFTLAVVDEGLLDLTNFKTPKPWSHFYAKEALGVRTWDMFDEVLGAYAGDLQHLLAIGGDMSKRGEKNNKVKRFKPVVKYFGPYYLAAGVTKKISFEMPNYVGSVRTMVVAGHKGAYGHTDETTPVRQPLMVLGTMPRVMSPGEVVDVPVSVFATDKSVKSAEVKLETNAQLKVIGSNSRSVTFEKPGDKLVTFKVEATKALGNAHVKISGNGNGKSSVHKIDMEVRSPNPPIVKVYDKVLGANEDWSVAIPNVGVAGTNKLTLEVSTLPSMNLENRLKYLIRYPHGCVEQTTSGAFPQLYLSEIATLTDAQRLKTKTNVEAAINRLYSFRTSEGGLAYWPGNTRPSVWGSNYALHFLILAKQNGYYVQENFLNEAIKYLQREARNFSKTKNYEQVEQAYRLYVLALAGKADYSAMNRLASIGNLSSVARYRLASAYALLNKRDMASKLIDGVNYTAQYDDEYRWYTYGSEVRDKSMALETLILLQRKEEAFSLLKDIADEFASDRWLSTQTTAFGLYAYAKYAKNYVKTNNTKVRYGFDGGTTKELFGEKSVLKKSLDPSKKANHNFKFTNTGGQVVYVKVYAEGVPLEPDVEVFADKIDLKVWYTDKSGATIDESAIKQGTEFIAHMKVRNPGVYGDYRNLALTQVIPAGWEIRNTRLNEEGTSADRKANYVDIRDDRIMLYFGLNKSKSKQFDFEMHATFTGNFAKPPVSVSAMYDNTIKAQVAGGQVKVTK